jgi:hypothetical protein
VAARQRRRSGCASFVFLAILAVVGGIAVAVWKGVGPLPDPEGCSATVDTHQVSLGLDQAQNATLIAAIALQRGLPGRAVSIALATAYQESKIRNLPGGDLDSVGIFQQRPSQGWGTVAQIMDPYYSIGKFYDALVKVAGYETMRITDAAQQVQHSGYPEAYEPHAADARALASALIGYNDDAFSCVVHDPGGHGTAGPVIDDLTNAFGDTGAQRTGSRQDLRVPVSGAGGIRLGWSVADYLIAHAGDLRIRSVAFAGHTWSIGRASEKGWQRSGASSGEVLVSLG